MDLQSAFRKHVKMFSDSIRARFALLKDSILEGFFGLKWLQGTTRPALIGKCWEILTLALCQNPVWKTALQFQTCLFFLPAHYFQCLLSACFLFSF